MRKPFVRSYDFRGNMPENVLLSYLSRAVSHMGLLSSGGDDRTPCFEEDLEMLLTMGAKYIGRASCDWTTPPDFEDRMEEMRRRAARAHARDPELLFQACLFENVEPGVNSLRIPAYVFEAFGLPPENRRFRFEEMLYPDGQLYGMYGEHTSPPDISRIESKLLYYYRGTRYIDSGAEAIHFGQYYLMNRNDPGMEHYAQLVGMLRDYARTHARRGYLLCDAHIPYEGVRVDGRFLYDFNAFPARLKEVEDRPCACVLERDYLEGVYGKRAAGTVPAGWETDAQPYLIEIDNYGTGPRTQGESTMDTFYVWNEDEITWLGRQTPEEQRRMLRYCRDWMAEHAPHCFFQVPTRRGYCAQLPLSAALPGVEDRVFRDFAGELKVLREGAGRVEMVTRMFLANDPSPRVPHGLGLTDFYRQLWEEEE